MLGAGPVPFPARTERTFQPWHRPRKQYVRDAQWSREIGFLARDLKLANGELRYLTLPGNDLLDIRHLAETICSPHEVRLRYLGFNTAAMPTDVAQAELNAAQFSINRLDYIHPESEVFPGDFRMVGNHRSVPWQRVRGAGPFHVINLDLCGGFAGKEKADGIPNYFTALQALLQSQASSDEDFLLFITTRMDSDSIDIGAQEVLNQITQNIYDTCRSYASEFADAWGLPEDGSPVRIPERMGEAEAFMLGLTLWIVSRGVSAGLKASVKSFMTYRTGSEPGEDDIVSLAIRFKPDPFVQPDPYGLVKPTPAQPTPEEKMCEQSTIIPGRVNSRVLVDEVLRTQADVFQKCMDQASELLSAAGYDSNSYRQWVMQEPDRYATA